MAGRMVRDIRKAGVRIKHAEAVHGCTGEDVKKQPEY